MLFTESLHHIPVAKQAEAINESCRVPEANGKLLITEPVYGRGSFEEISEFYHDERESRQSAIQAIETSAKAGFKKVLKEEIHIEYACKGFDDLYQNIIKAKSYATWDNRDKQDILNLLKRCDQTPEGDLIIDYFASVWLLIKR